MSLKKCKVCLKEIDSAIQYCGTACRIITQDGRNRKYRNKNAKNVEKNRKYRNKNAKNVEKLCVGCDTPICSRKKYCAPCREGLKKDRCRSYAPYLKKDGSKGGKIPFCKGVRLDDSEKWAAWDGYVSSKIVK